MSSPQVLLLIDASPTSRAALTSAARLARQQHGELIALFVEDQDLHASAGHPFTREISALSGESRPFDRETLLTRLAQQRHQIETMLTELDRDAPLRWRLDVVTGPVFESVRAAAQTADWVVMGKTGWSAGHGARLGSVARRLLESGCRRLLLWQATTESEMKPVRRIVRPAAHPVGRSTTARAPQRTEERRAPVVALLTSQSAAETVVLAAHAIAVATDRPCHLFMHPGIDPATLPSLVAWRQEGEPPLVLELIDAPSADVESAPDPTLLRTLQQTRASVVVLAADAGATIGRPLADLIADIHHPVILVPSAPV
ncbi:universal stress protein [Guyparkeria hydrothermalis]|uniref:universal stress protein n=1 Tax=Guyparkeria hydrothermalis TaxID=923 RepID=UPI00202087A1|nr:universal stress protein [Guyparkeria hydrothermalis]MCL7750105.1 universal stress protein [Guyparkeria hydrothermalis]